MEKRALHVTGRVIRQAVAKGSKSERDAVMLETASGEAFVLRRQGGPAFGDTALDALVGHSIAADGVGLGQLLIMRDWRSLD